MNPPQYNKAGDVQYPPPGQPGGYPQQGGYPAGPGGYPAGGQPGAYYTPNAPHQTTVIMQQGGNPMEDQSQIHCLLGMSIFATVCCNLICGIPAIVLAVMAMGNHDTNARRSQMNISKILSIVAIVFGSIFIIAIIALYVTVWGVTAATYNCYPYGYCK